MGRFRRYSWQNALLIPVQRPDATQVAGIHAWHDLRRDIKADEKGVLVVVPVSPRPEPVQRPTTAKHDPLQMTSLRAAYVFDVSQTEGEAVPELAWVADSKEIPRHVERLIANRPINPRYVEAISYAVAHGLGLENTAESVSVMAHAQDSSDQRTLALSLDLIQKTAAEILDELHPDERFPAPARVATVPRRRTLPLDAEGFGRFRSKYQERVVHSLVGVVSDRHKGEDIAARAFQLGWEKREQFRGDSSPYTWIQAIARNESKAGCRSTSNRWTKPAHPS